MAKIVGTENSDVLTDTLENDRIVAGAGSDSIYGSSGNDTITGGTGDDYIDASSGGHLFIYNLGDGADTISTNASIDTFQLGAGIQPSDLTVTRDAYNVYLTFVNTNDKITVKDYFNGSNHKIEQIQFADGAVWNQAFLDNASWVIVGTDGGDTLYGNYSNDSISGGAGDDVIYAIQGGNDTIIAGTGDDHIYAELGSHLLVYHLGDGGDNIYTHQSNDTLQLGAGIQPNDLTITRDYFNLYLTFANSGDKITLDYYFLGADYKIEKIQFADGTTWDQAEFDPTFYGTTGNDSIVSGSGSNYIVASQGGNDTITGGLGDDYIEATLGSHVFIYHLGDGADTISSSQSIDTLQLGEGIQPSEVTVTRDLVNLYLTFANSNDKITLQYYFYDPKYEIEKIQFANGTVWNQPVFDRTIYDTTGNDNITASADNDYIVASRGGNDTITGGAGDDYVFATSGNHLFVYNIGDGADTISTEGSTDTLQLGAGVHPSDVSMTRDNYNLYLSFANTGDKITLQYYFLDPANYKIEHILFADGTVWNKAFVDRTVWEIVGTNGNDSLYDYNSNESISGGAGNDSINAFQGGYDTISGGVGNDNIYAQKGGHLLVYNVGDGADTISTYQSSDTLQLGVGINPNDVTISRDIHNLYLTFANLGDKITLHGYFIGSDFNIEKIQFADGTVWDQTVIAQLDPTIYDTSENDNISAGATDDYIVASQGGNDTITGGEGDDYFFAHDGGHLFVYNLGDGADTLLTEQSTDTLQLGAGIQPSDVTLTRDNLNLYLTFANVGDKITLQFYFVDPIYKIEQIQFADGTVWNQAFLDEAIGVIVGTKGNDSLYDDYFNESISSGAGDDYIEAFLGGNDTINGGTGNDDIDVKLGSHLLVYHLGDGADTLSTYQSTDTLQLGAGIQPSDVTVTRGINNLYLSFANVGDKITLQNYFWSPNYRIEKIEFANGTLWNLASASVAVADIANATENGSIVTGSVAGNDSDVASTSLTYSLNNTIAGLTLGTDGQYSFNPNTGCDSIVGGESQNLIATYSVVDILGATSVTTLTITVTGVNDAPIANADIIKDIITSIGNTLSYDITTVFVDADLEKLGYNAIVDDQPVDWITFDEKSGKLIATPTEACTYVVTLTATDSADVTASDVFTITVQEGGAGGKDKLTGDEGDNNLFGGEGNDKLSGLDGNDTLDGDIGKDLLLGGNGDDTYLVDLSIKNAGKATASVSLADSLTEAKDSNIPDAPLSGKDTVILRGEAWLKKTSIISLAANLENLDASQTADTLLNLEGNTSDNFITGNDANNQINGDKGSDTLIGGLGDDTLIGGADFDSLVGGTGDDTYVSEVYLQLGANGVNGGGNTINFDNIFEKQSIGNDTVKLTGALKNAINIEISLDDDRLANIENLDISGTDKTKLDLVGSRINNILIGNAANNQIDGAVGNDSLDGGAGNDILIGGGNDDTSGNDTLNGGAGTDSMTGGAGDDNYFVDSKKDIIIENTDEGNDTLYSTSSSYILSDDAAIEKLIIVGKTVGSIAGNINANNIMGGERSNTLNGMGGNDTLNGGLGNDNLTGGEGNDVFVFNTALKGNVDTIKDFVSGEDHIHLDIQIFKMLSLDGIADDHFVSSINDIVDTGAYIIFDSKSGKLSYDENGTDQGKIIQFATIGKVDKVMPELTDSDFVIFDSLAG